MNSETVRGAEYEFTPWHEAMHLAGSTHLGWGAKLLEEYEWWRFEPHLEWVDPHCTVLEPSRKWSGASKSETLNAYKEAGGRWDLPYAAGIPGDVRFIYVPGHYTSWESPTIKGLERDVPYHAFLFNPGSGKRYELGLIVNSGNRDVNAEENKRWKKLAGAVEKELPLVMHWNSPRSPGVEIPEITCLPNGDYKLERMPAPQDWVMVLERVKDNNRKGRQES